MGGKVTSKDILNDAKERDQQYRFGFNREEFEHLRQTWKSLTRLQAETIENPRFMERFVGNLEAFANWSRVNGFGLDKELELFDPKLIEGTRLEFSWSGQVLNGKFQNGKRKLILHRIEDAPDGVDIRPEHWVTDYESRWVSQDALVRRSKAPLLTSYGMKRLRQRRKPKEITAFGATHTIKKWTQDDRCRVSDKVIVQRLKDGFTSEEAISTPPRQLPDRLKRRPKNQTVIVKGRISKFTVDE